MDILRLKAYGIRKNKNAWLMNPMRVALWTLIAPFFFGFDVESTAEIDAKIQDKVAGMVSSVKTSEQDVDSRFAGYEKEFMAVSSRMASLEEQNLVLSRQVVDLVLLNNEANAMVKALQADCQRLAGRLSERLSESEMVEATRSQGQIRLGADSVSLAKTLNEDAQGRNSGQPG